MYKKIKFETHFKLKDGFTLAEVLVTLAIIGIVAAVTIPSLVQNIQTQQYKVAWKKTFSTFNQATIKLMNDNNGTMLGLNGGNVRVIRDKYKNYLNVAKVCGYQNTLGTCWNTVSVVKRLNGALTSDTDEDEAGFVLADGTFINFGQVSDSNCNSSWGSNQIIRWCNFISFDINGFKEPNMIGKDIFSVYILKDRIVPQGVNGDQDEATPSSTCPDDGVTFGGFSHPGAGCAAKYLTQ